MYVSVSNESTNQTDHLTLLDLGVEGSNANIIILNEFWNGSI